MRADYKIIAKALGRIGSAYAKNGDWASAVKFYEKSLSEHRTPDILTKLRETEKQLAASERLAYINPEISSQEREMGNTLFKVSHCRHI
jgi:stress-induced-phosphoprotein 1